VSAGIDAVREAIYETVVATGRPPDISELVARTGLESGDVERFLGDLATAHVIVLERDRRTIRFAPPFAGVETAFRVAVNGRGYFAPCAWDAFGIPAALHADAEIAASCAQTGAALPCGVRKGRVFGRGLIHLVVPAAHFWDDIVYT
jgi:Alkylmercury lyase